MLKEALVQMHEPLLPHGADTDIPGWDLKKCCHFPSELVAFEAGCSVVKPEARPSEGVVPDQDGPGVK